MGVGKITLVAPVVFQGRANIPTDLTVCTERSSGIGGEVGNDFGASRGNWSAVEVEVAKKGGVGGERRMNAGGPEEVKGQDRLGEETVPFGEGKSGIGGAEDGNKVVFESPDGAFGSICTMFLGRRNSLELDVVFLKGVFESLGTFVVENVKGGRVTMAEEKVVGRFPGVANAGGLAVGDSDGVDRVSVVVYKANR
jgi:hypothetical protein